MLASKSLNWQEGKIMQQHLIVQQHFALKLFAALGCGLMAGVFFAFSTFVMSALARLQPAQGIAAMQAINITAINPLFMTALFGTAAACIFLAVFSLLKWYQPGAAYLLIGSLLYLVGTVFVTIALNVPLNDALAKVEPGSAEGAKLWASYLVNWTIWNHIRSAAALGAAALLIIGLCDRSAEP
ncbi:MULTISPECIES: anthrone oxygenase family protein [unclassified Microcoleus]|uniref:anthrone oxygenase family protein n=1 Tax=unclassified Microcoleus TaxID=2642155 RepID=UPI002FD778AB